MISLGAGNLQIPGREPLCFFELDLPPRRIAYDHIEARVLAVEDAREGNRPMMEVVADDVVADHRGDFRAQLRRQMNRLHNDGMRDRWEITSLLDHESCQPTVRCHLSAGRLR